MFKRLSNDILTIIETGANVRIEAKDYIVDDIKKFATAAKKSNSTLIIYNTERLLVSTIKEIAKIAGKNVTFEF